MKLGPIEINWKNGARRLLDDPPQATTPQEKSKISSEPLGRGLTGTPVFHGFLADIGEYNPSLEGLAGIRTYEEMRRSDAQVAATLWCCELPIRMADWKIEPASSAAHDQRIAAYVRDNLFGGLEYESPSGMKTSQTWDDVVRNALLMLAFGAAAHEEIFAIDGGMVRVARLAPRPPITFYRWITDLDGETLLALNQYGYRNANFESVDIPADRLAVFTMNKEGSNFMGRSMLRPAYMHWYIKQQLYRIDAIASERNGLGVPTIEQAAGSSKEDRLAAQQWVTQLATHEKTGIVLPPGWKLTLQGVSGQVRDPYNSILHHNIEISRTALAFFMNLGHGSRSSGNRSLSQSQTDFFYGALQATASQIAQTVSATTIKRLVDFNWENVERYPVLTVENLRAHKFETVFQSLSQLATSGLLQPSPELDQYIARKLGVPGLAKNAGND